MIPGPWTMSDEQARARDAAVAREFEQMLDRATVHGMSQDALVRVIERHRYSGRDVQRVVAILPQPLFERFKALCIQAGVQPA